MFKVIENSMNTLLVYLTTIDFKKWLNFLYVAI